MIYVVDDDKDVGEALAWLLRSRRHLSERFESAEAFEAHLQALREPYRIAEPSCVLLDVRMPGTSGLVLFERLVARGLAASLPVIFLTGHADIPTAVAAVKAGAFDFCEKPFSDNALVDRVERALDQSATALQMQNQAQGLQARIDQLTERERQVMQLVAQGLPNKLVADQLDISVRTVEVHRARVFDKMRVRSAVELANLLKQA
jgi:two-component system, LuxR family, response regulator DctR